MLEGKTFLGATGMPMKKIARVSTRLAVWLPEPLTVAAWIVRSLTTAWELTSGSSILGVGCDKPPGRKRGVAEACESRLLRAPSHCARVGPVGRARALPA